MKTLSCQDMGVSCDFVAKAETDEEVIKMAMDHAKDVHPEKVKEMMSKMSEQEIMDIAKSKN